MLKRIDVPVVGAVLVGASDMPAAYRYYRYRYYGASTPPSLSQRLRGSPMRKHKATDDAGTDRDDRASADDTWDAPRESRRRKRDRDDRDDRGGRNGRRSEPVEAEERAESFETHDEPADGPVAEPAPIASPTNGSGEHVVTDESLSEFWQEFKERR